MGYLESSVVVYLREIMYPDGFSFPLVPIDEKLAITEIFREAATVIMLLGAGILAGKTFAEKFAWFIYCFAIWDIFYYVFLKAILNWPESFMTWDILFVIPAAWTGPVLSPVIVSVTMIVLALIIVIYSDKIPVKIKAKEWAFFLSGSVVLIIAFIWDFSKFVLANHPFSKIWSLPNQNALYDFEVKYIPQSFNWFLFTTGMVIILSGIVLLFLRLRKLYRMNTG